MLRGDPYFFMIRLRSFSAAALSRFAVATASKGVVTLPCSERQVSVPQGLSGRCDRGAPGVHRRGAKRAVRLGRGEMALDVKGIVDRGVRREKFLRRTRTLEPLHLALPPSRRLMRILRSIVLPSPALMPAFDPKISDRGAV